MNLLTPRQLHSEMDLLQHALADVAPDVRDALEVWQARFVAAYLDLWNDRERLSRCVLAEQRALWAMVNERSAS